jgi:hypothetical protein
MRVAEAVVQFLGDFTNIDKGLVGVAAKAEPHAKTIGGMFATHIGNGIKLGLAGLTTSGAAAALMKLAEPLERSEVDLKNAIRNTGKSWEDYKGQVQAAVQANEKLGTSQQATQESLSKLTVATGDPALALKRLSEAEDLAAYKHISLTDASSLLIKMYAGNGKAFKEFGINVKTGTQELHAAEVATKAHTAAQTSLEVKTKALSDLEARDAGVKKLSVAQQQQLAAAHKAVGDAQAKVIETQKASEVATAAASGATKDYGKIIEGQVLPKIKGLRDAQAETFFGQMAGAETHVKDFAANLGGKLAPALAATGPVMMGIGGILESGLLPKLGEAIMWTVRHTASLLLNTGAFVVSRAAMLAGAAASGVMTAAQWALNVALDANPIGLVVIAIAALVSGVVLAYQHVDWFRAGVNAIWQALKDFAGWIGGVWKGAMQALSDPLKAAGDALNAINPFAKHSPSLVENVRAGVDEILGHYSKLRAISPTSLSTSFSSTSLSGLAQAALGGGDAGPAGTGGRKYGDVNVHINAPQVDPQEAARQMSRALSWTMKTT